MTAAMSERFLPYGRQSIDDDDIRAVVEVLRGDWLTSGPTVGSFETALTARCGCADTVAVANGTAALHLALQALGIGDDDAVIVPAVTFVSTANVARLLGAEVVFADVDPANGLLTEQTCRDAIARSKSPVRAIVPVHLGGRLVDMPAIGKIAKEMGAVVLEDACHAIGAYGVGVDGKRVPTGSCAHSNVLVDGMSPAPFCQLLI